MHFHHSAREKKKKIVVIIGGGFGGLQAAKKLSRNPHFIITEILFLNPIR